MKVKTFASDQVEAPGAEPSGLNAAAATAPANALTGRTVARQGVGIVISVWYDEHQAGSQIRIGWSGKIGHRARKKDNT